MLLFWKCSCFWINSCCLFIFSSSYFFKHMRQNLYSDNSHFGFSFAVYSFSWLSYVVSFFLPEFILTQMSALSPGFMCVNVSYLVHSAGIWTYFCQWPGVLPTWNNLKFTLPFSSFLPSTQILWRGAIHCVKLQIRFPPTRQYQNCSQAISLLDNGLIPWGSQVYEEKHPRRLLTLVRPTFSLFLHTEADVQGLQVSDEIPGKASFGSWLFPGFLLSFLFRAQQIPSSMPVQQCDSILSIFQYFVLSKISKSSRAPSLLEMEVPLSLLRR